MEKSIHFGSLYRHGHISSSIDHFPIFGIGAMCPVSSIIHSSSTTAATATTLPPSSSDHRPHQTTPHHNHRHRHFQYELALMNPNIVAIISSALLFFIPMFQLCLGACDTSGILNFRLVESGLGGGRDIQTLAASRHQSSAIPLQAIVNVSIGANACRVRNRLGLRVDSVCFTMSFDGATVLSRAENRRPYYANGDRRDEGIVNALPLDSIGVYTLLAETYDGDDCEGIISSYIFCNSE